MSLKKNVTILGIIISISLLGLSSAETSSGALLNGIEQIIKIQGTYPVDVDFFDVVFSPAVGDMSKTIVFMDFGHVFREDNADTARSWELINTTAIRIFGDGSSAVGNNDLKFEGKIIEFNSTSPILVQRLKLELTAGATEQIFNQTIPTPINMSNTFILPSGVNYNSTDITIGSEELQQIFLKNSTSWSFFVADTPNTGNTTQRVQVIDWNEPEILVQRGNFSFTTATASITPPTAVDADFSWLLMTYSSDNGLAQAPRESSFRALMNTATDDIDLDRTSGTGTLETRWEIVTFPQGSNFQTEYTTGQNAGTLATFPLTMTVNPNQTVSFGTVHTYFGDGNTRAGCNKAGCWEELMYRLRVINPTTIEVERGGGGGSHFPVGVTVDLGGFFPQIDLNVTPDIVTVTDVVNTDVTGLNVFNQTVIDVVTAIDLQTSAIINFTGADDTVTIIDAVDINTIFVVNVDDNATVTDVTQINITKLFDDAVPVIDLANLNITKILSDLATASDSVLTDVTTIADVSILDTVTADDLVILSITKIIDDTTTVSDTVDISRILDLILSDIATINDPTVFLDVKTQTKNGSSISSGGGGGVPTLQRLVGLSIQSELFFVGDPQTVTGLSLFQPVTVPTINPIPSDFIIQTFGREDNRVSIVNIQTDQQFTTWFQFSRLPQTLQFETEIDRDRSFTDPARFTNIALNSYVLTIPTQSCANLDPISSIPCIDPILYEIPVTFSFSKGGVTFNERHFVTVDASTPLVCDPICQLVEFLTENYWWLAGIVIVFMMLYFLGGKVIRAGGIKTVRRIDQKAFTSFEAKPKRKFKRGKG